MNLHDEIAKLAFELYEKRGCVNGYALGDWLEAEGIVKAKHAEAPEGSVETGESVKPKMRGRTTAKSKEKKEEKPARKKSSATTVKKTRKKKTE